MSLLNTTILRFINKNILMSCLPDLFTRSKSLSLPRGSKVGGIFSIHLKNSQSISFEKPEKQNMTYLNRSLDNKQYRSGMDKDSSFTFQRSKGKSAYRTRNTPTQLGCVQELGFTNSNIVNQESHQTDIQAISCFNISKRHIFESVHLSTIALETTRTDIEKLQQQIGAMKIKMNIQFQTIQSIIKTASNRLLKQFRQQKRQCLRENKIIKQQMVYLEDEIGTTNDFIKQIDESFSKLNIFLL